MKLPRWYPILDTGTLASRSCDLEVAAEAILNSGARILQLRHKGHWSRAMFEHALAIAELCRRHGALYVINDRADIANILAAGLHVGQEDLKPVDARLVVGDRAVVGYSTHNEEQLRAAAGEPVDYIALGPVFGTASKLNPDPPVGLPELARVRHLGGRPLVAIGGITLERAADVLAAGADSVAVISGICPPNPDRRAWEQRAEEWMRVTNA